MKNRFTIMLAAAMLTACNPSGNKSDRNTSPCLTSTEFPVVPGDPRNNRYLTIETMLRLGQINDLQISPDGKTILYSITSTDIPRNNRNRQLFTVSIDGRNRRQITQTPDSKNNPVWIDNGKKIAFLSRGQIHTANPDGSGLRQISKHTNNIEGFKFSPDNKKILFISAVQAQNTTSELHPDLDKTTGRIINNLMYKHWDEWTTTIPHPFVAHFDGRKITNITDLLEGQPYESPLKPFGGTEQFDFSPDSKTIAYTCRKKTGKNYAQSTNSDIFLHNLRTSETKNLTENNPGYDINPQFSPDGRHIAWLSMERDGYESDKNRLMIRNLETGNTEYVTANFDYDANHFCWANPSTATGNNRHDILFISSVKGTAQIFLSPGKTGNTTNISPQITQLTEGPYDYTSLSAACSNIIALRQSISSPNEIFRLDPPSGTTSGIRHPVNISNENSDTLSRITFGKEEERWITTVDNRQMHTLIIYPPQFDPSKKYPAILFCQGGPQSAVSRFWSTRWNLQLIAAGGYIVIAPNRRGVPGFGTEWKEQISGDYSGLNMLDYLSAVDHMAREPYIDETRLGCTGASYGGFSVYWLAGHHNKRFKAFWAHAGIFNLESQYLETEEIWFADWDLGGPFWKPDKTVRKTYAGSPHRFVDKWDSPIAVSHGELDYRILASQGMMAFNAAQLRGIPSQMLIYPDENHWILKPQNSALFHREFFRWFDYWLK
jgi:dipeptidyl aminopeptidase/acylaminoacyl peptidase